MHIWNPIKHQVAKLFLELLHRIMEHTHGTVSAQTAHWQLFQVLGYESGIEIFHDLSPKNEVNRIKKLS